MKKYAIIPDEFISDGIKWLVVEKDPLDSGGYFLYHHKVLEEPCVYDDWFRELEHALQAAKEDFGINENDWKDF